MQVYSVNNNSSLVEPQDRIQKELDKNAFLQLLVAQLKNQNPLQPQDTDAFVAQMVQFTTLEQLTNMTIILTQLQQFSELNQGTALIGHLVKLVDQDGKTVEGEVEKVALENNKIFLYVNNQPYELNQVTEVY